MVNFIPTFLILFLLAFGEVPRAEAEISKYCCDVGKNIEGLVVKSDPQTLLLENGQLFSLAHFLWDEKARPWIEIQGRIIKIEPVDGAEKEWKSNRYGEKVGKILTVQIGWLQKYWMSQGLAAWKGIAGYPDAVKNDLLKFEKMARSEQRGVWKNLKIQQADKLEYSGKSGSFNIVEGKVHQVRTIGGVTYLNFSEDWKTDFTAAILPKNRVNFRKQSWKLADLENKWIRVRGAMRYYNGPYMNVVFPDQIELLDR